ncbi:hypothetical protein [Nonlabens xiamenensis]|uniref:hypothetical protein n=1 Tax=Nonlabens xiamenensis TaxID=2341043 RepID=UPI000F611518|nr:hypothetical protein [Nonlabens xiamenensis]
MRFKLFYLLVILMSFTAVAQIGVNTDDPASSSILDISAENKGVLFPRMDLGDLATAAPVNNPAIGLLVWNTDAASGGANQGFYYWNNAWVSLRENRGANTGSTVQPSYGQLTLNADLTTNLQQYTFTSIDAPSSGFASADLLLNDGNQFSFRPTISGVYRVSFTITYKKSGNNGAENIQFYIFKNNNAISDAKVTVPLTKVTNSVSFSKFIKLDAYQYYGLGISASNQSPLNLPITILSNQTQINIERVE